MAAASDPLRVSFAELERLPAVAALPAGAVAEGLAVAVEGFVLRLRSLGRGLVFLDLLEAPLSAAAAPPYLECMAKEAVCGGDVVETTRRGGAVTNMVALEGSVERTRKGLLLLRVTRFVLLRSFEHQEGREGNTRDKWRDRSDLPPPAEAQLLLALRRLVTRFASAGDLAPLGRAAAAEAGQGRGHAPDASAAAREAKLPPAPQPPPPRLCRLWRKRQCPLPDERCAKRHYFESAEEERANARLQARATQERRERADPDDPHAAESKADKRQRAALFAEWLVREFTRHALSAGAGVLDIAGGRGGVAFQLQAVRGVPCTVIDPRPMRLDKTQRRFLRDAPHAQLPRQECRFFDDAFCAEREGLLREAAALVGMHPDQATEPIVDAALRAGKPFAVVPCCVFARLFSARRGPGGAPVRTYAELIAYLRAKDARIRVAHLPFTGRNVVLYMRGEAGQQGTCGEEEEEDKEEEDGEDYKTAGGERSGVTYRKEEEEEEGGGGGGGGPGVEPHQQQ
jgi:hypothetical protein